MWTIKKANERVGGLSRPGKMPGYGFGISAFDCQTGARLRDVDGSTCFSCYATRGRYTFRGAQAAHKRRLALLEEAMKPGGNLDEWVSAMAFLISSRQRRTDKALSRAPKVVNPEAWLAKSGIDDFRYFRWHDSGDIQSPRHLHAIVMVAKATPGVSHWLPTREYAHVKAYLSAGGSIPNNLTIRLSAHMVDGKPPSMGLPTSTVSSDGEPGKGPCPAPIQGGECKACRSCWDRDKSNVDYHIH